MNQNISFIIKNKKHKGRKLFFFFISLSLLNFTSAMYGQKTACPNDFDCDGVIDAFDVDDDNDGIYDHIESPGCFELDKKIYETGDRKKLLEVSTALPNISGTLEALVDGVTTTNIGGLIIPSATLLTDKEIFRLTTKLALGIEYASLTLIFDSTVFNSTARGILQGSNDGLNWTDLTDNYPLATTASVTISVTKNQGLYKHYRLMGTASTTYVGDRFLREITGVVGNYMPSLYPKAICEGEDIDGDGQPNHQDLDADGDGTADVLEAGFSDLDRDGILGNSPITVNLYGAVTSAKGYSIPYEYYKIAAIDAAKDRDGDGVWDLFDLDDDNDGIYDHIESPGCFELEKSRYETGDRKKLLEVSTALPNIGGTLEALVDGVTTTNTGGLTISPATLLTDKEIFRLTTKLALGIEYATLTLYFDSAVFITGSRGILQGSNDGFTWIDLTDNNQLATTNPLTISVTKNQGLYRQYRLMGTAGNTFNNNRTLREITAITDHYMPSFYPKATCTGEDIDGDGIPNHQDLDTDGDGTADVLEAGFPDPDRDGMLGSSPIKVDLYGAVIAANGYSIPYEYYKIAAIDAAKDKDGDGVWDLFDVDDDNDGIYDHIESPGCFELDKRIYETGNRRELFSITTTLPYTTGTPEGLIDGVTTDVGALIIPASTELKDREIFRLTTKLAIGIEYSSFTLAFNSAVFVAGLRSSKGILQGSNDGFNWTDLTEDNPLGTGTSVTILVAKNQGIYRHYRLLGTDGATTTTAARIFREITTIADHYMPSLYPKVTCEGEDIDGDGIPNHQDLDTDGDGTADVLEAGFPDPDRDGMLGNSPIKVDLYGAVITATSGYTTPYEYYKIAAIDAAKDKDGDGIWDLFDVDDDNDGIYDHIESPGCFELEKRIYETGNRSALLSAGTTLPYTSGTPEELVDGITNVGGIIIPATSSLINREIFRLTTKLTAGIEYSSIALTLSGGLFLTGSKAILQGSNDGLVWTDLTEDNQLSIYSPITIPITKNQALYRHYRLFGTNGTTTNSLQSIREITGIADHYMPSLYPKALCEGEDLDKDGIPNHQDLDTDGDGVYDVVEAGFSDPDTDGKLGSKPIVVDRLGAVTSALGYSIPYEYYKMAAIDPTKDTDGDGVWDLFDVDDDNDGIYDHIESPGCFESDKKTYETGDRRIILSAGTTLPYTNGTLETLVDGIANTAVGITIPPSTSLVNREIFRLTTKLTAGIEYSSIILIFDSPTFNGSGILQGSNDGANWTDLTEDNRLPTAGSSSTLTVTKNQGVYRHYRLLGTAGTTSAGPRILREITGVVDNYLPSLYPKTTCEGEDIDGDGIQNHQDLDTDGDGAFDVLEAGFLDPDRDGKLGNSPVTVNFYGQVTSARGYNIPYEYYKIAAIDATKDADNDGVWDLFDADDDNDGIYDHIESPGCFELNKKAYEDGNRIDKLNIDTTLPYTSGTIEQLIDGISNAAGITIPASTPIVNREIFRLTTKLAIGIEYSSFTLYLDSFLFSPNNFPRAILQGSNDGLSWTDLTENNLLGSANPLPFQVTKNQGLYRMYRLLGTAGITTTSGIRNIREITGVTANFLSSLYPKLTCEGEDINGDGIPNHQDLNSDGDTCSDVLEVGFLDEDRDGILGNSPVTVNQYGMVTSAQGYTFPRNLYWLDITRNVCTGVGVPVDEDSHCSDLNDLNSDTNLAQSTFHSTIVTTKEGYSIFGQATNPSGSGNLLSPTPMTPENGFTYEGEIRLATLGGITGGFDNNQYFILSTKGLYVWGPTINMAIPTGWTTRARFSEIQLPAGITPENIKNMSASFTNLLLLTKWGEVYIAAGNYTPVNPAVYGDGSTVIDNQWHKAAISHVTSIKINSFGQVLAVTNTGELYTWGDRTFLGDGSGSQIQSSPAQMTLPAAITQIRMTALTSPGSTGSTNNADATYFVLGDDKRVYSLGGAASGILGTSSSVISTTWQTVKSPQETTGTGYLENIKFITATVHDNSPGAAGAVDERGTPYFWGQNGASRLGAPANMSSITLPRIPDGVTPEANDIIAVEMGGHVTPVVDRKLGKFGYVGHRTAGSMGIPGADGNLAQYDFENTPVVDFCNLQIGSRRKLRVTVNPMNINTTIKKIQE